MSARSRLLLVIIGLLLVIGGLAALGYALWPLADSSLQSTLAPTLFTPP